MPDTADVIEPSGSGGRLGMRGRVAVVAVAVAVVAALGWVVVGTSDEHRAPSSIAASAVPTQAQPELTSAPFALTRDGNTVTLTGSLANTRSKSELAAAVKAQWLNATLNDKTTVVDGAGTPDMAAIGNVFSAADAIADFGLAIDGATVTLMGTAPNLDVAGEVQSAAALSFPGAKLANNIQIPAPGGPVAPPVPEPSSAPAPAPAPAGGPCAKVQADVTELLRTPISFVTGGSQMTGESRRLLVQIADKIKGCPNGAVTVIGYTDNQGSDAVNLKLSDTRAKAVAAALVSNGVQAAKMTARGAGAANPIADNNTEEGRAKNRRVEITVG
ncbi:peptidoglycan-binding protein ArfA [Mycolicibacterium sp. TY66]|uniref:channel-forming protein ArfA/OmpATb n=1 Tax=unclassified Mycolicibacterium TaxID=2636767 RepID=UPI001BB355EB|nr:MULTISPECIES: OmpA family protein [unclassified Mycolicibacterium]BCI84054.1 peptidoglycan-binding protein ArfA [Mycolicibacterium sp. TY66]BCJ84327.1 peptidoglycan-binding protein ArfA [Mycolicibacterium sp. TY81]